MIKYLQAIFSKLFNCLGSLHFPFLSTRKSSINSQSSLRRTLYIEPDELPNENIFWALTIYEMQGRLFSSKIFGCYLINPHMEPQLKRDADGGITFYIQHDYPGRKKHTNWLPAPKGNFWMSLKLYRPGEDAVEGSWPELRAVGS